ncbi:efflux RND transporter periplasmic adaptor subunit [Hydrogenimonas urashimensis]|uniref:efflux RND transporter periplasmic adaptor subunit n=1 Tax=Hydrogenimonas urashimensis TaxID=2740515 RepID=UPI0019169C36|nr:efflux RND transporter periplasmic adaptor subunit [Hydrogenimonas urashimensis]
MKKWLIGTLLLPLSLLAEQPSVEQLFNVQTTQVKKETIRFSKTFYGLFVADEERIVNVSPRFDGYVVKLYKKSLYAPVKRGEPLAKVYAPAVFKAKEEYLNALRYAKKAPARGMVASARRKLQLLGVSKSEIDRVKRHRKADPLTQIYAPANGYLFEKHILEGGAFKSKSPLFRIVGLSRIRVEAKVSESDIVPVMQAKSFRITTRSLPKTFVGKHPYLYPRIEPETALATVRLDVANPEKRLIPGMFATVRAETAPKTVLVLPRTAVIRKMGRWFVFKAGEFEGEYEPVEVTVRPIDHDRFAILSGVKEGDEVVNKALFLIDSDAQINGLFQ